MTAAAVIASGWLVAFAIVHRERRRRYDAEAQARLARRLRDEADRRAYAHSTCTDVLWTVALELWQEREGTQ